MNERTVRRNQFAYIIEAALEYFISLLVAGAYLSTLLKAGGFSDGDIGLITQLASVTLVAQLVSVFYKRRRFKNFCIVLHLVQQALFVFLYIVPSSPLPAWIKSTSFVVFFLLGKIVENLVSPYKLSWLMSYVPDKSRGRFTANKEIVSLAGGMLFTYAMGAMSDHYKAAGDLQTSFVICALTVTVLAVFHTVSLVAVREEKSEKREKGGGFTGFADIVATVKNKTILKLIFIDVLWHLAVGVSVSFFATYQIGELGFSMKFVAINTAAYSIVRIAFSRYFGTLADKTSWTHMITICFGVACAAFALNAFTKPLAGSLDIPLSFLPFFGKKVVFRLTYAKIMYTLHYCLYGVSLAGINSGLMNIIFDFVPHEKRPAALGIKNTAAGVAAFAAAIVGRELLNAIQHDGNRFFGFELYAQQVLSALSALIILVLIFYIRRVVKPLNDRKSN